VRFNELPTSKLLVTSDNLTDLVDAFALAVGSEAKLTHVTVAYDGPQTRVFLTGPWRDANPVVLPDQTPAGIAKWIFELKDRQLPYPRPKPEDARKGWSVSSATFDGVPGVIVTAAWVNESVLA